MLFVLNVGLILAAATPNSVALGSMTFVDKVDGEGYVLYGETSVAARAGECYSYSGIHWAQSSIPVGFSVTAPSSAVDAIASGYYTWNGAGTSFRFAMGGGGSVSWTPIDGPGSTLATSTVWYYEATKEIVAASAQFDSEDAWATDGDRRSFDIQSVAAHEAGHWLALGHTGCPGNVMNPTIGRGEVKRGLGAGDVAGINAIYGAGTTPTSGGYTVTVYVYDSHRSQVEGAAVSMDSISQGTTDYWGRCIVSGVSKGTHAFTATKQGYKDVTKRLNVKQDTELKLILKGTGPTPGPGPGPSPVGYTVIVNVFDLSNNAVSGATIYVDDVKKGTTDSSGRLIITGMIEGYHVIIVKKRGYQDAYQREYINRDTALYVRLYPA
jgi:hypothetical protein